MSDLSCNTSPIDNRSDILSPATTDQDIQDDITNNPAGSERGGGAIRPTRLTDFNGQYHITRILDIAVKSALIQNITLDHVFLSGPPGLGKTTLARIIGNEMGAPNIVVTNAATMNKAGDVAAHLVNLQDGDVLFIDEVHRLSTQAEELLYSAMEDFRIELMIGDGIDGHTHSLPLSKFTLIGATTRPGSISTPMRDRFGIHLELKLYSAQHIHTILASTAPKIGLDIDDASLQIISQRSRGTPRIAHRLLRRVNDYYIAHNCPKTPKATRIALEQQGVDHYGLNHHDRAYIRVLNEIYNSGPAGVDTIAKSLNLDSKETIESVIEPYLMHKELIKQSPSGRLLTQAGIEAYENLRAAGWWEEEKTG